MNTKNPKYKEYLRLRKEIDDLNKRYSDIIEAKLGPKTTGWRKPYLYNIGRNAIDYTEVKSEIRVDRKFYYKPIPLYLCPQDKDIIALDLLNNYAVNQSYRNREYFGDSNLFNFEITEQYYKTLAPHLQDYFRRYRDLKYVQIGVRPRIVHDSVHMWPIWETIVTNKYFFKYDYPLQKKSDKVIIERYDIFSDIQKAHDFLEYKEHELARDCGFYRYGSSWKKAAKAKRSRAILKQQLREIKDYNEDYDLAHKYHYPHNDKWFYD